MPAYHKLRDSAVGMFSRILVRMRGLPFENELRLQVPKSLNGRCPLCAAQIEGHYLQVLGGAELDPAPAPDLTALIAQTPLAAEVSAHKWLEVILSPLPRTRPALLAVLLLCPSLKESAVLLEAIPFTDIERERWVVWKVERVTPQDMQELARLTEAVHQIEL